MLVLCRNTHNAANIAEMIINSFGALSIAKHTGIAHNDSIEATETYLVVFMMTYHKAPQSSTTANELYGQIKNNVP